MIVKIVATVLLSLIMSSQTRKMLKLSQFSERMAKVGCVLGNVALYGFLIFAVWQ